MSVAALRLNARTGTPWGAIFLGIAALGGTLVVLLHLDRLPFAVCAFKAITGLPCATCGSTRAVARLAHLDLAGALAMNPLATVAGVGLLVWGVSDIVLLARGRALGLEVGPALGRALRIGIAVAVAVNWAYLIAAGR